jgi:hypothetical protein
MGRSHPSEELVDDILLLSEGDLAKLIRAARLAVTDWRDVRLSAQRVRSIRDHTP